MTKKNDPVNHPSHYQSRGRGRKMEAIEVMDAFGLNFNIGSAVKYALRSGDLKKTVPKSIQDLEKAIWYLKHEIRLLKRHM